MKGKGVVINVQQEENSLHTFRKDRIDSRICLKYSNVEIIKLERKVGRSMMGKNMYP